MSRIDLEREYWNEAALDPNVDRKYISDISTDEMIEALEISNEFLSDSDGRVLEIGCGVGRMLYALDFSAPRFYGIDISENMLDIACEKDYAVRLSICDGRTIPEGLLDFDFVYSVLVFQHLKADTIQSYIQETFRVLEPGGIFRFQFIEGDEQEPFSNHYSLDQMKTWLEDARLEFIKADKGLCHPMWTWVTARKP